MDSEVARFAIFTVPLTVILSSIYIGSFDKDLSKKDAYGDRILTVFILSSILYFILLKSDFDFRHIMTLLGLLFLIMYFSLVIWSLILELMKTDYDSRNGGMFVLLLLIGVIVLYAMRGFLMVEIGNSFSFRS
jgi:hypothetical protein